MQKSPLSIRTAALLSLSISLLLNFLFFLMFVYGRDAVMSPEKERMRTDLQIGTMLIHTLYNFVYAFALYLFYFNEMKLRMNASRDGERLKWWQQGWFIFLTIIVIATIFSYSFSLIRLHFSNPVPQPDRLIRGGLFRDYFIALIVVLSGHIIYLSHKQQQTALENKTLLAENLKTRFAALKNQVDPHFLFNSLNTLNSLIKMDADKAQEYVQQLSFVFRYTLQNKEIITLEEELKFTRAYCHLMQIRYGDGLQFICQIEEQYFPYLLIPLSLQTLVENAIKHNIVSAKQPLTITIAASANAVVHVANPIQLKKEAETGERIGLNNLSERYRLIWQKEIVISQNNGVFQVEIPLIKPEENER